MFTKILKYFLIVALSLNASLLSRAAQAEEPGLLQRALKSYQSTNIERLVIVKFRNVIAVQWLADNQEIERIAWFSNQDGQAFIEEAKKRGGKIVAAKTERNVKTVSL